MHRFQPTDCRWHLSTRSERFNRLAWRAIRGDKSACDYLILFLLERMLYLREHYTEVFGYDEFDVVPKDYTSSPYPPSSKERIYLAAMMAALFSSRGPHDKIVTGKRGRPRNTAPYLLGEEDDDDEYRKPSRGCSGSGLGRTASREKRDRWTRWLARRSARGWASSATAMRSPAPT
jgi:hypothetical protein